MWKKIIGYSLLSVLLLAALGCAYFYLGKPAMAAPSSIKVDASQTRIARGKYMFEISDCDGCHSEHDDDRYDDPVRDGRRAVGRLFPDPAMPGRVIVPNITPDRDTGLGNWTDGEKIRAIREGISRDGRVLFPLMPYSKFRHMSDEDVQSLVAYMNTLPPVRNELAKTKIVFPVSMFMRMAPRPVTGEVKTPDHSNKMLYGEYLVTFGGCETCHTQAERGEIDTSKRFAGGRRFGSGEFLVVSANITPDRQTGIGDWSLERFQQRIYKHKEHSGKVRVNTDPEKFTIMPWENLSQLPPEDLEAIFVYLQSRPAISNKVDSHPVETQGKT